MGLKTTWVCVKGADRAAVLDALGLVETRQAEGNYIADAAVAGLPGGWTVVHFGKAWRIKAEQVAALFANGDVVWGTASDTVMWSGAYGLVDGRQVWSVEHDPDTDVDGLQVEGAIPAALAPIRADLEREQAKPENEGVDYIYEAPMALTKALTGYDPARQYHDLGFLCAEQRLGGAAGEQQRARLALIDRLVAAVRTELEPAAEALGFVRADSTPDSPEQVLADTLVRFRDGWIESLDFEPATCQGVAKIGMKFFVRRGSQGRAGSFGQGIVPPPKRGFLELFTGRKEEPADVALARAVQEAKDLLGPLDEHLKHGTAHPHIRPATYYDQPGVATHR